MYGSDRATEESEQTAFRRAEKKYKLYYDYNARSSRKKKLPREVDLSDVLDFKSILESYDQNGELPDRVYAMKFDADCLAFCLEARPGFYFIPGALSIDEQCHWIKESLLNFPQPPNRTNHKVIYGPIPNLFNAAKEKKIMVSEMSDKSVDTGNETKLSDLEFSRWKFIEEDDVSSRDKSSKSVLASVLLRKLRWSTLGLQFDWSKRNYNAALQHQKIPDALGQLARRLTAPAMKSSGEFQPEAAIVNYFGAGDTLGGHLDDMEADWSKPIVSMSLGCKAIFLLGGKSRQDPPLAMFLRSGDVVLMAAEARECFHGKSLSCSCCFLFFYLIRTRLEFEYLC
uniref:Alpha-ketoglutarate-dependent dioxygenase AlkB-like domain-containing protein n=1 Tax=Kalanchoe fedtschenkoi TaxID=63787 RepID=A0A7N0TXD6_KALFE